jgi:phage-related protein
MAATDATRGSVRADGNDSPVNLPDGGGTVAEREYEDYVLAERDSGGEEPDVLLDVPVVKVDEINLEVEELRARILLQAEVLDLLKLNVGADVFIGHVGLEIKGVEAQALLKVRLDNVARILDRVLTTIDRNPQLLEGLVEGTGTAIAKIGEGAGSAVEDVGEGAGSAVEDVGEGAGSAVEDVGEGAGSAVEDVGEGAGSAVEDVGEGAGSAVEDVGEGAGSAVEDVGVGAGSAVEDVGEGAGSAVESTGEAVEDVGQRAGEAVEDTGQTAKRRAQGASRTADKAASRAARTAKRTRRTAPAQEQGAAKQPSRSRESQGTKRSSRQPSGPDPDSKRRSRKS